MARAGTRARPRGRGNPNQGLTRICAWCGSHLGGPPPRGDLPVSHGICEDCARAWLDPLRSGKMRRMGNPPRGDERLRDLSRRASAGDANAYVELLHERARRTSPGEVQELRETLHSDLDSLEESLIGAEGDYDRAYDSVVIEQSAAVEGVEIRRLGNIVIDATSFMLGSPEALKLTDDELDARAAEEALGETGRVSLDDVKKDLGF